MATQPKNPPAKKPRAASKAGAKHPGNKYPNGWSVLGMFFEGVFGLFNTNKIYPAILMMCFLLAGLVVFRLPQHEIAPLLRWVITSLGASRGGLVGLLSITNLGWLIAYRRRRSIDRAEIERLSAARDEVMYKQKPPSLTHYSSEDAENEVYIVPSKAVKPAANRRKK